MREVREPEALRVPEEYDTRHEENVREVLIDLYGLVKPFVTNQSGDYTTTGEAAFEYVRTTSTGTGTQTISLHATPRDLDRVQVKRAGTAPVTVDTDGSETIDGNASITIGSQYDAPLMMYTDEAGEWELV